MMLASSSLSLFLSLSFSRAREMHRNVITSSSRRRSQIRERRDSGNKEDLRNTCEVRRVINRSSLSGLISIMKSRTTVLIIQMLHESISDPDKNILAAAPRIRDK